VTWKQIGLAIVAKIRAFLATGRGKYTAIGGAMVIVFVIGWSMGAASEPRTVAVVAPPRANRVAECAAADGQC
jgi:hypothetical protein